MWARQTLIMGWENPLPPLYGYTNYWTKNLTCSNHTTLKISAFFMALNVTSLHFQQNSGHLTVTLIRTSLLIVFTVDKLHEQWTDGPVFWFKCVKFQGRSFFMLWSLTWSPSNNVHKTVPIWNQCGDLFCSGNIQLCPCTTAHTCLRVKRFRLNNAWVMIRNITSYF